MRVFDSFRPMWTGLDASQVRIRFRTRCGKPEMQMPISFVFFNFLKNLNFKEN
jgi:hypothetical protein